MRSARWFFAVAGLSSAFSCGSRSDLQTPPPSASSAGGSGGSAGGPPITTSSSVGGGDAGGSTSVSSSSSTSSSSTSASSSASSSSSTSASSSSSSSSTSSSSGGPVAVCDAVEPAASILTIAQPSADLTQPSIVTLYTTPPTTAVVLAKQAVPQVTGSIAQVGTFAGWDAWPPVGPSLVDMKDPDGVVPGVSILATSLDTWPPSLFAFLYRAAVFDKISPSASAAGVVSSAVDLEPGTPLTLVADTANVGFLGAVSAKNGSHFSLGGHVKKGGGKGFNRIGCATTPVAADAAPVPSSPSFRWLVAVAVGTTVKWDNYGVGCPEKFGDDIGPATKLSLISVDPSGIPGTLMEVHPMPAPVTRIRMAPRSDGAWAVWSLEGGTTLSVARLTTVPSVMMELAPIVAQAGSLVTTTFDVKALGDTLVVAAVDRVSGGNDQVELTALDGDGTPKWSATLAAEGAVDGPLSLLTSPDGASLLLAWSELPPGAATHRVRIARLDCVGGP